MAGSSGHYVLRQISSGGMGRVELILRREGDFERLYALKRLLPEVLTSPSARGMFLDEARIAGLLRHPHVVSVHDVGEDEQGPFLVMDFVEGVSAQSLLKWSREKGELLPQTVVLDIAVAAAEGLTAAHELRDASGRPLALVHRDVSPQNVLIGFDGTVRLTDFGIAKILGQSTKTSTGILKGKLGYMSPEQLRFDPLDQRSDLFSLGVVIFELCAGRRLYFDGDSSLTARRILREPPPDLGQEREDVSPDLVGLLFELLAKEPSHRPSTARDVADRIAQIASETRLYGEGGPSLREFMESELAEVRQQKRSEIEDAKARLERGEIAPMGWRDEASRRPPPLERRAVGPIGWIAVLLATALLAATGAFVLVARPWETEATTTREAASSPALTPSADEPGPGEPPTGGVEAPPSVEPAATAAGTERRPRRARRRPRAAAMASAMEPAPASMGNVVSFGGLPIAPPAMSTERAP